MLSTMAKCNVTIINNFTLETYLCYSNINQTGKTKSIHSLLHQKYNLKARVLLDYECMLTCVLQHLHICFQVIAYL